MSTNKFISYLLCNKGIIINLYKLYFLSSHFSFQPNKRVFHLLTFPSLQPNTHEGKLNISILPLFHPPTNFSSSQFSTPPSKQTLSKTNCISTIVIANILRRIRGYLCLMTLFWMARNFTVCGRLLRIKLGINLIEADITR